jgi:hypothetical protein
MGSAPEKIKYQYEEKERMKLACLQRIHFFVWDIPRLIHNNGYYEECPENENGTRGARTLTEIKECLVCRSTFLLSAVIEH